MIILIEIAVYAAVATGGALTLCTGQEHAQVTCSNGLSAIVQAPARIVFSNGLTVERNADGYPYFSDSTKSWLDSMGWLTFSNGMHVRKMGPDFFKFANGLVCEAELPVLVECRKKER